MTRHETVQDTQTRMQARNDGYNACLREVHKRMQAVCDRYQATLTMAEERHSSLPESVLPTDRRLIEEAVFRAKELLDLATSIQDEVCSK